MTTLNTDTVLANVEAYLAAQYAKREVTQHKPVDGVVVILAWCVVVMMIWK